MTIRLRQVEPMARPWSSQAASQRFQFIPNRRSVPKVSRSFSLPLRAFGLDHPWALRDRGCRRRRLVVHRQHSEAEPCRDLPCTKFGRPWVGGIEGWSIDDLVGVVNNKAMQFVVDEIFPLIDAWKALHGYPAQIPPTPQPSWGLSAP